MKNRILVLNRLAQEGLTLLASQGYEIDLCESGKPTADMMIASDGIVVRSAKVDTALFPGLIAVARAGAGYNNITVDKATESGTCVFNTPGANANAVAELVFIMLGMHARRINNALCFVTKLDGNDAEINAAMEAEKARFSGFELANKTLGVIGLGKIGVLVANAGIKRGMRVVGYDAYPTLENMHQLDAKVERTSRMEDVLALADILSVHVPLNEKTKNLIGAKQLAMMKLGCVLMNYARDGIVDNAAVISALAENTIAAYITDFPTMALRGLKNVICTPHLGASTDEAEEKCAVMAVTQLRNYLEFGTVTNSVNFPVLEMPLSEEVRTRLVVVNNDVPNMIAVITGVLGGANINIHGFTNASNGKIGYNLVDLATVVAEELVEKIRQLPNVLRVRVIEFSK